MQHEFSPSAQSTPLVAGMPPIPGMGGHAQPGLTMVPANGLSVVAEETEAPEEDMASDLGFTMLASMVPGLGHTLEAIKRGADTLDEAKIARATPDAEVVSVNPADWLDPSRAFVPH